MKDYRFVETPSPDVNPFNVENYENEKINRVDRLEAFSDGVFGVAITLLVLNIRVPLAQDIQPSGGALAITLLVLNIRVPLAQDIQPSGGTLANALLQQWPVYLSYVISFLTVGIVWANHHQTFAYITHSNHPLRMLNLFLLMTVTLIPFTTELLSSYMRNDPKNPVPDGQTSAAVVYALGWVLLSIAYNILWQYALRKKLVDPRLTPEMLKKAARRPILGLFCYIAGTIAAFFNPFLGIFICLALAIYYLIL